MHHFTTNISITILVCLLAVACFAGPPVPVLVDDEPGLLIPLDGDPNDPSTWRFGAEEWGKNGHRSPGWVITDESPFSDAAVLCSGNIHPFNETVNCPSPVYRFNVTMKNIPGTKAPMDTERDWVLKFDVKVETVPGDTLGGDKLFEPQGVTAGDIITITGASEEFAAAGKRREAYSYFEGQANRYKVRYGPAPDGSDGITSEFIIPDPIDQGTITLHYKSANQRLDLWIDENMVLGDFESYNGSYDLNRFQIGGGGVSFEHLLIDNVMAGVLVEDVQVPGDANADGVVDVADLGILGANFGAGEVLFADGDFNGDNMIDVADLGILGANWTGAQSAQGKGLNSHVPEPATMAVVAIGLVGLGCRRVLHVPYFLLKKRYKTRL